MVDACLENGVPEPEYEVSEGFVRIVFKRSNPSVVPDDFIFGFTTVKFCLAESPEF